MLHRTLGLVHVEVRGRRNAFWSQISVNALAPWSSVDRIRRPQWWHRALTNADYAAEMVAHRWANIRNYELRANLFGAIGPNKQALGLIETLRDWDPTRKNAVNERRRVLRQFHHDETKH